MTEQPRRWPAQLSPMRGAMKILCVYVAVMGLGYGCASKKFQKTPPPLRTIVPADNNIPGWVKSGQPQLAIDYTELSRILGGDAISYIEGDVISAIFQRYHNTFGSGRIRVRAFRLGSKRRAEAFFHKLKPGNATGVTIGKVQARSYAGAPAKGEAYVMEFWAHDVYGVVASDRNTPKAQRDVQAFVAAMAQAARW